MTLRRRFFVLFLCFIACAMHLWGFDHSECPSGEVLLRKCDRARDKSQYDQLLNLANELLRIANENDDDRYRAYGLFYKGLTLMFIGKGKEAKEPLNQSEAISKEIGNDSVLALVYNAKGIYHAMYENNLFLAQNYFLRSLEATNRIDYEELKARVHGNLIILSHSANDTIGLNNAHRIYQLGIKHKNYELHYMGTYFIAMYNYLQGKYDTSERYIRESIEINKKYPYDDIASVYTLYSQVKQKQGHLDDAEQLARRAMSLAKKYKQMMHYSDAEVQLASVLQAMGKYKDSNEAAFGALKVAQTQNRMKVVDCYRLIAKNYGFIGEKDLALDYMNRATMMMDTLSTVNMDRLMHERQILSDMEQKEQEAEINAERIKSQRVLNIVLGIFCAIMAVLLWYILRLYTRRNALYKNIVVQNTNAVRREKELLERIHRSNELLQQTEQQVEQLEQRRRPRIEADKAQELYDKLCLLMEHDRIYTDTQLNRERVAEMLGTNRTYLSQIIKEKAGVSYVQFVNDYRINDAIRILSDSTQADYPLKQICYDLGFNSSATFYKLFQQAVGITPSVYRKQFLEIAKKDQEATS